MFCSKCGQELKENQKFCPKCGTPVATKAKEVEVPAVEEPAVEEPAVEETTPVVEEPVVEEVAPVVEEPVAEEATPEVETPATEAAESEELPTVDSVLEAKAQAEQNPQPEAAPSSMYGESEFSSIPAEPVKKKVGAKTWFIIGLIVVIVAAAVAAGFFFFKAAFASPKKLMKDALVNYVDDAFGNSEEIYNQNAGVVNGEGTDGVLSASLTLDDGLRDILEDTGVDLDWLDNASVTMKVARDDDVLSMDVIGSLNDVDIATLVYVLSISDQMGYMQLPEFSDKYLSIDFSEEEDLNEVFDMLSSALENNSEALSMEDVRKLATKYTGIVAGELDDIEKDKEELEVDDVAHKYYALSATIDTKTASNIAVAVGKEILDDKELKEVMRIFYDSMSAQYYYYDMDDFDSWYDDFLEEVENMVDEQEKLSKQYSKYDEGDEELGEFIVYVDMKGELKGFELSSDSVGKFYFYYPEDGKDFGLDIGFEEEYGSSARFYGSGTKSGGKVDGEFKFESDDEELFKVEVVDFDEDDYEKGQLNGEFIVSLGDDVYLGYDEFSQMMASMKYDFVFESSDSQSNCKMSLTNGGTSFATLTLGVSYEDVDAHSVPSDALDVEDSSAEDEYMSSVSFDEFISNLKKAGVPQDYLDMIEEELQWLTY